MGRRGTAPAVMTAFIAAAMAPAAATAQDTYVSASLTGDIVRFDGSGARGGPDLSGSGEALGFALRVGTSLGSMWGVEAEFARASRIESEGTPDVIPLGVPILTLDNTGTAAVRDIQNVTRGLPIPSIYPPISYRVRTSYQNTTLSTAVWARQEFSSRLSLVYSGGVSFHRVERDVTYTFELIRASVIAGVPAILPQPFASEARHYSAHPFAGIDARIGMTDHVELVPGVRLHGLDSGLMVRPSVGLGWKF